MSRTSVELVNLTYPAAVAQPLPSSHASRSSFTLHLQSNSISSASSLSEPRAVSPVPIGEEGRTLADETGDNRSVSRKTTAVVISSVTCITGIGSMLAGVVVVVLPAMAKDIGLDTSLLLWPSSIYALTCGCTLLLAGAVADAAGPRPMYLLGCLLQSAFTLACGLSRTGPQLLAARALAGVSAAFCLPSAVSIITHTFPEGRRRNAAFACMGAGQPVGFSVGLTLGGVFADTIGWRWGFYLAAVINTVVLAVGAWGLPSDDYDAAAAGEDGGWKARWRRLGREVDWVGALMASGALALLSYVLAAIAHSRNSVGRPANATLLSLGVALLAGFVAWSRRRERRGRAALIPSAVVRSRVFACVCAAVFLVWGTFNAAEHVIALYFQYIQGLSALQSSVRFLPSPVSGVLINLAVGLAVHRVRADAPVALGLAAACASPLLVALADPKWSYWAGGFPAIAANPAGADVLFTVGNLLVTSAFPARTQAVAGGVFNTVAQVGKSVGLATSAAVAAGVTAGSAEADKGSPGALLEGYRAAMWYCFALNAATLVLCAWGLRKIGKVGVKRD